MSKTYKPKIVVDTSQFSPYLIDSIIYLLIFDVEFLNRAFFFLRPRMFSGERKIVCELCFSYFSDYKEAPGDYIIDLVDNYIRKRPSQKKLLYRYIKSLSEIEASKEYVTKNFGGFIRDTICKEAIKEADILVDRGKIVQAQQLILERFKTAYSVTATNVIDYMGGIRNWYGLYDDDALNFKTLITPYDKKLGGLYRSELLLLFADTGIGKTNACIHLGIAALRQGKNVLHITLETPLKEVKRRYASSITARRLTRRGNAEESFGDNDKVSFIRTSRGKIAVKPFTTGRLIEKLNLIARKKGRLWLEHGGQDFGYEDLIAIINRIEILEGAVPDVIIIDSPDQMRLDVQNFKEFRYAEKHLYRQLLDLREERNLTIIVTTQAGRKASGKKVVKGDDVAESYDKIRIVDTVWTFSQNYEEYTRNIVRFLLAKSRNARKFMMVEIETALDIGQFAYRARRMKKKEITNNLMSRMRKTLGDSGEEKKRGRRKVA